MHQTIGVRLDYFGVPGEGWRTLAGESPVMAKAGNHVAWVAGGDGNITF